MAQHITRIDVFGMPEPGKTEKSDHDYMLASIDGGPRTEMRVTVRTTSGHPLQVFLDGGHPLYPTVVYDGDSGELLAVSPGRVGMVIAK